MAGNWCTIESDPGVFTELIAEIGVQDIQVEEMFNIDKEGFGDDVIYGLIFLFKYDQKLSSTGTVAQFTDLWFAKQVIVNACATQALISILMNAEGINLGPHLSELKEFTKNLDPEMRGLCLSNSKEIKEAHNSFNRPDAFEMPEDNAKDEEGDAYHFVAYMPYKGKIYELDGLKPGPIECAEYVTGTKNAWHEACQKVLRERMEAYTKSGQSEIRFNLLKVVKNRQAVYQPKLKALQERLSSVGENHDILTEIQKLETKIAEEKEKFLKWDLENTRRKHNYIPMILCYLKHLTQKGLLKELALKALTKQEARIKAAQKLKEEQKKEMDTS